MLDPGLVIFQPEPHRQLPQQDYEYFSSYVQYRLVKNRKINF
ncbi:MULTISPECIES: hypothetical protein [Nostocaceae]|uniref:Uncharacterized protein n=1 Tax=Trichormus variabilis NIES-23 TaxID=1973479 RepID=A0A1Z4KSS3_ANAVA|nr:MULTISPECIES: hypothetical protein [Nostocaceae]BAY72060.1 hypothetical protein NIES23_48840 [Trichormus variabilis NIES-23]